MGIGAPCAIFIAVASAQPVTFRQALQSAVKNNPAVELARAQVDSAQGVLDERSGVFAPALSYAGSAARNQTVVGDNPYVTHQFQYSAGVGFGGLASPGTTYQVSLNASRFSNDDSFTSLSPAYTTGLSLTLAQPLLKGRGPVVVNAPIGSARYELASRDAQVRAVMLAVAADTAERYWGWRLQQDQVAVFRTALDLAKEQLRVTQARAKAGAISALEVTQAEATVAQRDDDLRQQQLAVIGAERTLLQSAYLQQEANFAWKTSLEAADAPVESTGELDLDALTAQALEGRPEIRQLRESAQASELDAVATANGTLARLDATLKAGLTGLAGRSTGLVEGSGVVLPAGVQGDFVQSLGNLPLGPFIQVGLEGELPLGHPVEKGRLAQKLAEKRRRRALLAQFESDVKLEIRSLVLRLQSDHNRVLSAREAERLAAANLDAEKKKFAAGVATTFDVLRVQGDLVAAKRSVLIAVSGTNVSLAQLGRATGTLLQEATGP